MAFEVGDLLKFKEGSWWTQRDRVFRHTGSLASYVLVTNSLLSSERFFYGVICGSESGEEHLWSGDQFDMVSAVGSKKNSREKSEL
mgnify:FL=1